MPEDTRNSQRVTSDTHTVPAGDATTQTVLPLNDEQTFSIGLLKVEYAGSATVESALTLYDDDETTTSGNLSDMIDRLILQPGDRIIIEDGFYSDVEEDLVAASDGNSDGEIQITVGGPLLTG